MMRAVVIGLVCLIGIGGCASLDSLLRNTDDAKTARKIQQIAAVVDTATTLARSRGLIGDATAETLAGYSARAKALAFEGNITLAKMMLLQIVGELPSGAVAEAEADVGVSVADALVVDGG